MAKLVPSIEMVRFVSSGTEATMSAVRLARGATGRKRILKTDGGYHGHADGFLVAAGSGVATLGIAGSPGVPDEIAALTTVVPYNDAGALEAALEKFRGDVAAFIVEPVAANMGLVLPQPGYLEAARELTRRHGALLIFDEVISGFRLAAGGAQEIYGVAPDLTTLGKILGGGLPVGAYGGAEGPDGEDGAGRARLPGRDAFGKPAGDVRRPRDACRDRAAAALRRARAPRGRFSKRSSCGRDRARAGSPTGSACRGWARSSRSSSRRDRSATSRTAKRADTKRYAVFFHAMRERGIFLPPAQFEAWFVSTAHGEAEIRRTARMAGESLSAAFA